MTTLTLDIPAGVCLYCFRTWRATKLTAFGPSVSYARSDGSRDNIATRAIAAVDAVAMSPYMVPTVGGYRLVDG